MFAIFTKYAWLFLQPSSLIAAALAIALWRVRQANLISVRRWLSGALAALLLCGGTSISDLLIIPLEDRFARPDLANADITGLIVLGGSEDAAVAAARNVIAVNEASERLIEGVALARRFPKARLVFAGGGDVLSSARESEAAAAGRLFEALGIAPDRITLEAKSQTTWENATLSAPLIAQQPGQRWLLVTSAWQMPRAMGAFRKAGLIVEAYPVDYRTTGQLLRVDLNGSLTDGLRRFDYVVREYPALLVYWLTGRSSALFPRP
jgi:uncharacterized SAM-binding protein YcdF (DUF218 family)